MSVISALAMGYQAAQSVGMIEPLHRSAGKVANIFHPNIMPPAIKCVAAWRAGKLPNTACVHACVAQGIFPPEELTRGADWRQLYPHLMSPTVGEATMWQAVHDMEVGTPSMGDAVSMFMKGLISRDDYEDLAKRNGFWQVKYRDQVETAFNNQMPSPGELVTFALKECWDRPTVERYQYDAEFPPEFKTFMKRLGMDGEADPNPGGDWGQGGPPTWSQIYWRAHWRTLSPSQAYEMFQRLRPNRLNRFGNLPGLRSFTFQDVQASLKINDFPLPYRSQLAAIAYRKPRLVDIDRFYRMDSINKDEAYELHLDLGYSPADARMRVDWLEKTKLTNPNNAAIKRMPARIVELYGLGRLRIEEARNALIDLVSGGKFTSYDRPPHDSIELAAFNNAKRQVDLLLEEASAAKEIKRTQRLLNAYRRQYLHGQVNAQELASSMHLSGFSHDFITQFIREQNVEMASGRLLLSTERIRRLVVQSIMPIETAKAYLINLGWKQPEIDYIVLQLTRDLELEQAHQEERVATDDKRREAARLRVAALAERKRNHTIRNLNRQATPAQLRKYYVRGIINRREYERELERRGHNTESIKRLVADATIDRDTYQAKRRARAGEIEAARAAPPGNAIGAQAPPAR